MVNEIFCRGEEANGSGWKLDFRRNLFQWEHAVWNNLLRSVSMSSISRGSEDCLIWKGENHGIFSAKYLCDLIEKGKGQGNGQELYWDGMENFCTLKDSTVLLARSLGKNSHKRLVDKVEYFISFIRLTMCFLWH